RQTRRGCEKSSAVQSASLPRPRVAGGVHTFGYGAEISQILRAGLDSWFIGRSERAGAGDQTGFRGETAFAVGRLNLTFTHESQRVHLFAQRTEARLSVCRVHPLPFAHRG